jgi:hypothetical protein
LRAAPHLIRKHVVVGDVETDGISDLDASEVEGSLTRSCEEVARDQLESGRPTADHGAPGDVFAERDRMRLGVRGTGPAIGKPQDAAVVRRGVVWSVEDAADQRGDTQRGHGLVDDDAGSPVAERVDCGGVFRPYDEIWRALYPLRDALGKLASLSDVVGSHLSVVARQITTIAGHATLHNRESESALG